jgi:hypothetical protein
MQFLFIALFLLLSVSASPAQRRDTICLDLASSNVCTDMAVRNNAAERRVGERVDEKTRLFCRNILAEQFARDCAQRFRTTKVANPRCHDLFKQHERNYRRDLRRLRADGADVSSCF